MSVLEQTGGRKSIWGRKRTPAKPVRQSLSAALAAAGLGDEAASLSIDPLSESNAKVPLSGLVGTSAEAAFDEAEGEVEAAATVSEVDREARWFAPLPLAEQASAVVIVRPQRGLFRRHGPSAPAALPWLKPARRRRTKERIVNAVAWVATLAVVIGMIGVAATFLALMPPAAEKSPIAQR